MSVSTSETREVETIKDILEQYSNTLPGVFTNTAPDVYFYWEIPTSEKDPGDDLPNRVYVWSPTSTDTGMFSADGDEFLENATVEIQCWSLYEDEAIALQQDIVQILSDYFADNDTLTEFTDIRPVNKDDFREQNNARRTQSYITSIECELTGLRNARTSGESATFGFAFDSGFT